MPRNHWPIFYKERTLVFLRKDEAIFSEALREVFPHVTFIREWDTRLRRRDLAVCGSLAEDDGKQWLIVFPDDERWQPRFTFDPETGLRDGIENILDNRTMRYRSGGWDWSLGSGQPSRVKLAYDPPTPMWGKIVGSYNVLDPLKKTFFKISRSVWNVIDRIAIGCVKHGHPLGNELEGGDRLLMKDCGPSFEWHGHSALEWCREGIRRGERRMLAATRRPADDWEVPDNTWYQSLRRRVEEEYGRAIDDPPPPPPERDYSKPYAAHIPFGTF